MNIIYLDNILYYPYNTKIRCCQNIYWAKWNKKQTLS